jgi:hypothetical protein
MLMFRSVSRSYSCRNGCQKGVARISMVASRGSPRYSRLSADLHRLPGGWIAHRERLLREDTPDVRLHRSRTDDVRLLVRRKCDVEDFDLGVGDEVPPVVVHLRDAAETRRGAGAFAGVREAIATGRNPAFR